MIQIKVQEILHPAFVPAMNNLTAQPLDFPTSRQIQKLCKTLSEELVTARAFWNKFLDEHALKDEKGVFLANEVLHPFFPYKTKEGVNREDIEKTSEEFWKKSIEVEGEKINSKKLEKVVLSANELSVLSPLIED